MDDFRFYVFFNSISVIPPLWEFDNERLCAMEIEKISPQDVIKLSARSIGQHLTHWATRAPQIRGGIEENSKVFLLFLNENML